MALLYVLRDNDEFSDVARLALILDRKNFDRLIDNCGGLTFTIPTRQEVNDALRALLYYQMRYIRGFPVAKCLERCGMTIGDVKRISPLCKRIGKYFRKLNPEIIDTLRESLVKDA